MSNEVYGYCNYTKEVDLSNIAKMIESHTGIGVVPIPINQLFNFPLHMLPQNEVYIFSFCLGDFPGKVNATYLIDYLNYAPEAKIGLPLNGAERLALLASCIRTIINLLGANNFKIALTDSSQIEEIKSVSVSDFLPLIITDSNECAPPNCLYDLIIDKPNLGSGEKGRRD